MLKQRGPSSKRSDCRRLAARLGSQGSVASVSESEDDDEMHSQHSLADVELMMMMPARSLKLDSTFLTPVQCPAPKMPHCSSQPGYFGVTDDLQSSTLTPTKVESTSSVDPLTPTSNLKMLSCVASPEIRQRDELRAMEDGEAVDETTDQASLMAMPPQLMYQSALDTVQTDKAQYITTLEEAEQFAADSLLPTISRKEKSLGLLCQRFLSRYPEYPANYNHVEICLDEVAKDLSVERRRIYDIVNVLESVEIVSRLAKNRYVWHGKSRLSETLSKLKALAKLEGFAQQIEMVKDFEVSRDLDAVNGSAKNSQPGTEVHSASSSIPVPVQHRRVNCENILSETVRKEKSLGIMSQKFLMLFLVSQPKTVNLDISAKILIGNPNVDRTENGKFKTKIRRLYDIANILTSLQLIRKVHVTEVRGRKPAFKYVGPEVYDINDVKVVCSCDEGHRSTSKHSLLDCIQNGPVNLSTISMSMKSTDPQLTPAASLPLSDANRGRVKSSKSLSRHASFEVICEVAAQERNRLYFESRSQPTSPTHTRTPTQLQMQKPLIIQTPASAQLQTLPPVGSVMKHLMVIRDSGKVVGNTAENEMARKNLKNVMTNTTVHKIPLDNMLHAQQDVITLPVETKPSSLTLSKEQLDSLIKTISVVDEQPTTVLKTPLHNSAACYVDAATQSSPQLPATLLSYVQSGETIPHHSEQKKRTSTDGKKSEEKRHRVDHAIAENKLFSAKPDVEVANIIQQAQTIWKPLPVTVPHMRSQTPTLRIASSSMPVMLLKQRSASLGADIATIASGVDNATVTQPLTAACYPDLGLQSALQPAVHQVSETAEHTDIGALSTSLVNIESLNLLPYFWSSEYSADNKLAADMAANLPLTSLPVGLLDAFPLSSCSDNQAVSTPVQSNIAYAYPGTSQIMNYVVGSGSSHWPGGPLISPDTFFRNTPSTTVGLTSPSYTDTSSAFVSVTADTAPLGYTAVPRRLYHW